jgi:hypothetical protein
MFLHGGSSLPVSFCRGGFRHNEAQQPSWVVTGPGLKVQNDKHELSKVISEFLDQQDRDWVTEILWTEEHVPEAGELERQADAA